MKGNESEINRWAQIGWASFLVLLMNRKQIAYSALFFLVPKWHFFGSSTSAINNTFLVLVLFEILQGE